MWRCGGCAQGVTKEIYKQQCPARIIADRAEITYDWGRWLLDWAPQVIPGRRFKQKSYYHHPNRWRQSPGLAEQAQAKLAIFGARAWTPHATVIAREYYICARCGEYAVNRQELDRQPCRGETPWLTGLSWSLIRDKDEPTPVGATASAHAVAQVILRKRRLQTP